MADIICLVSLLQSSTVKALLGLKEEVGEEEEVSLGAETPRDDVVDDDDDDEEDVKWCSVRSFSMTALTSAIAV